MKHNQRGITLIETLVALALVGIVTSLSGSALFQFLTQPQVQAGNIAAAYDVRNAAAWVARDAQMAQTTNLVDGAAPVPSLSLGWTDAPMEGGASHTVAYTLSGGTLLRTYDGQGLAVAHYVRSAGFSRSGSTILFTVTSQEQRGKDIQETYWALMRSD
jgi:prepilin-type N-terminal cleavage/methylation domain-containing protein